MSGQSEESSPEVAADEPLDAASSPLDGLDTKTSAPSSRPSPALVRWAGRGVLVLAGLAVFGLGWSMAPRAPAEVAAEAETEWTCAMHPEVRLPGPGECPICAMDLVPATEGAESRPDRIELSERAQTLARIRTVPVSTRAPDGSALRLLGQVDYDETTLSTVTTWVAGRLERLHVQTTGASLRRGQTVASVYSPEVHAAANDLIVANRQLTQLAEASPLAQTAAQRTLEAARSRLRLLGVPAAEVDRMGRASRPPARVAVRSPYSGTVVERLAAEGETVPAGAPLYRLADLDRVWVQLDAYEADLSRLSVGQSVTLRVRALPDGAFEGRVAFIDPVIDPARRTARVRVEVDNEQGRLRPGMYAEAELAAAHSDAPSVSVPASAPLFTGTRSLVYVEVPGTSRPTYEAREVRLGARVGQTYPVLAGVVPGERVVVHGAFVLDADQQLSGRASMMNGGVDSLSEHAITVPAAFSEGLRPIVAAVLQMSTHLAADDYDAAHADTSSLLAALTAFSPTEPVEAVQAYEPLARALRADAERSRDAATIELLRESFEALTASASLLLSRLGNPMPHSVRLAHCPMAFNNRGAVWLQTAEQVDNAYFGDAMRTCGTIRQTVAPGAHLRGAHR